MSEHLKVALIGTRGIPARYGGFETCAQEVSVGLVKRGHDVTVYCRRGNDPSDPREYEGVRLLYVPHVGQKALGTPTHGFAATIDAMRRGFDVFLYFNAANSVPAVLARLLGRIPVVINVDGLEWERKKWGRVARNYYRSAAWLATRIADRIVADSRELQRYYEQHWVTPSTYIPYGAQVQGSAQPEILDDYGLAPDQYFLVVARLEPENNTDLIVDAFSCVKTDKRLVVVGGAPYRSRFADRLHSTADGRVMFLGPVYDPSHVRELYCGAFAYLHGHEVGGTNPALLQALGHGCCVLALDVPFNIETVGQAGLLFERSAEDLYKKMTVVLDDPTFRAQLRARAPARIVERYRWDQVIDAYELMLRRAASRDYRRRPPSDSPIFPNGQEKTTRPDPTVGSGEC